jgi:DNA-binding NarL/FixJ family response regulator
MKNIPVLNAEYHAIVREGLCMLLKNEEGIEVIAQA